MNRAGLNGVAVCAIFLMENSMIFFADLCVPIVYFVI